VIPVSLLAKSSGFIIGPIAEILGVVLNKIFEFVHTVTPVGALGISIILFTIFVRVLILPLMLNQQMSMKRMQEVQPELQKIQAKYKDKKDPESQKQMSQEMSEFYKKNKINPLGGCLPLLIQMPVFFALFKVLREASSYIAQLREIYNQLATSIMTVPNYVQKIQAFAETKKGYTFDLTQMESVQNLLSKLTTVEWNQLVSGISQDIVTKIQPILEQKNNIELFFGISLIDSPMSLINQKLWFPVILLPILAGLTTFLSSKLMTASSNNQQNAQAVQTQKTMNTVFPFLTAFMTLSLPAGLGLYWITSNIFQIFQQLAMNKYMNRGGKEI
jgi:YidC/Oxa1 family membrane protein insertase